MADREKVIKGLECCSEIKEKCDDCPYSGVLRCMMVLKRDALELLKEQEPVEPVEMIDDFYPIGDPLRTIGWKCGKCGDMIAGYDNFCPNCGRAVKWDD